MKIAMDFGKHKKIRGEELFVASYGGKLVGSMMLSQTDNPSIGQLRFFAVEKNYRNYGIGSALIDAFMKKIKEFGYK